MTLPHRVSESAKADYEQAYPQLWISAVSFEMIVVCVVHNTTGSTGLGLFLVSLDFSFLPTVVKEVAVSTHVHALEHYADGAKTKW